MVTLEQSIINTLAYFDSFDYPLTLLELHRYLWHGPACSLGELSHVVHTMPAVSYIDGYCVLRARESIVYTRSERYLESIRKLRKRLPYIWLLSLLPHVRAIFIVNSVALLNAKPNSDIDLCIVTTPGKIWSTRFFTTAIAKLLGIRPHPPRTKDTLCLSFYVSESHLNLRALLRDNNDIHELYWLRQMMPVYDPNELAQGIDHANTWIHEMLPNATPVLLHPEFTISKSWLHRWTQTLLRPLAVEPVWRWLQLLILPKKLKQLSGPISNAVVVLSSSLLKFHTRDPRPSIQQRWEATIKHYSTSIVDTDPVVQRPD